MEIEFNNHQIFEINGSSMKDFSGIYTSDSLADYLIYEWTPLYKCHNCGRGDYCKYAKPIGENTVRKQEIQCGVVTTAFRNYLNQSFYVLEKADHKKKQAYLNASFHFHQFVLDSEQWNGRFIDSNFLDYCSELKYIFGVLVPLRDTLNNMAKSLKEFPELYIETSVLLVEGETENTFIQYAKGDENYSRGWNFIVEYYKGKSNKTPQRLKMLLEKYQSHGYKIFIQGDEDGNGDGSGYDKFRAYVDDEFIDKSNIFQFKYDFESSIPLKILYSILIELGYLCNVSYSEFEEFDGEQSINQYLISKFGIDTKRNGLKLKIAKLCGKIMFRTVSRETMEKIQNTEIGRFIDFLNNVR